MKRADRTPHRVECGRYRGSNHRARYGLPFSRRQKREHQSTLVTVCLVQVSQRRQFCQVFLAKIIGLRRPTRDFHQMIAKFRADWPVDLANFLLEYDLVELRHHLAGRELAQITPLLPDGHCECFRAMSAKVAPPAISALTFSHSSFVFTKICRALARAVAFMLMDVLQNRKDRRIAGSVGGCKATGRCAKGPGEDGVRDTIPRVVAA